jgi:hypothetical protein
LQDPAWKVLIHSTPTQTGIVISQASFAGRKRERRSHNTVTAPSPSWADFSRPDLRRQRKTAAGLDL